MKTIIGISLGSSAQDFVFETRFLGVPMRIERIGCDGSRAKAERLIRRWDGKADAIGLGLPQERWAVGKHRFEDEEVLEMTRIARKSPATTGARLGSIFLEWAVRETQARLGRYFDNAVVLFFSGLANHRVATTFSEYTQNLSFADPIRQLGVPKLLTSLDALGLYAEGAHYVSGWKPPRVVPAALVEQWTRFVLRRALSHATTVVAPVHELDEFGLEELAGKTVVTSTVNAERVNEFADKGVALVVDAAPEIDGRVLGPGLIDAMILAATGKTPEALDDDDYLAIVTEAALEPRLIWPGGERRINRFAFVIHPLSQEYFKKVKPIELLSKVSPPVFMDALERAMAYAPPFVYSKVSGIRSPTGVEVEGWLISVGGTPREIMKHPPEFTYRRLLDAAEMARKLGAQIMGLGAFTKVVGDAGVTVARRAPLPITTGNSYSASGALWAAHDAMLRLGLLAKPPKGNRAGAKAMVVGATGAIGSVCARLLAKAVDEVTMVSPETAKLLALRDSILAETPDAKVRVAARPDKLIAEMDMIVTATSGAGKKVLDIMQVKPGCVITDVARPLDLSPEDVARRPDVLVVESGEIELPGEVEMKNIGLPRNVVYACLAETIVLALEGRFENFTVGRQIEWEKVREIYRMGLKHGMKLAAISGVNGPYSDADIARVRRLALAARGRPGLKPKTAVAAKQTALPPGLRKTASRRKATPSLTKPAAKKTATGSKPRKKA